ncbi:MAG: YbaK/EbsC family protein [Actinomycetota bacterium]
MASESVQRVIDAGAACGLAVEVEEFPDGTRTAADAAAAVGCKVDQIVKSMIFDADGEIVLALTSGAHQVDGAALAALAGVDACDRADPEQVRAVTGYAIGGVAPIGHTTPVRTWVDPHLLTFERIWAAAGTPRHVFAVDPRALVEATGAVAAEFTTTG